MPAQEFRRAVQHDIYAKLNRPLVVRCHKCIVNDAEQVIFLSPLRDQGEVRDFKGRIGRRLHKHGLRIRLHRRLNCGKIRHVDEGRLNVHPA
ncbi:hypothetical protein D3C73_1533010 [compost metagenome]